MTALVFSYYSVLVGVRSIVMSFVCLCVCVPVQRRYMSGGLVDMHWILFSHVENLCRNLPGRRSLHELISWHTGFPRASTEDNLA